MSTSKTISSFFRNSSVNLTIVILLILAVLYEVAVYHIGLISGDYYKILNNKDRDSFWKQTAKSIGLIIAISLLLSLKNYVTSYLYVKWRQSLTGHIHKNYFKNLAYFRLNVLNVLKNNNQKISHNKNNDDNNNGKTDNIDQRITQDIDKMFSSLSVMIPEILVSPFIMSFYWYKCQSVSGWVGPLGCLALFIISTLINVFLIKHIQRYVYAQERCEGDFRFQHLRIRNNAEPIAFISGESMEKRKCDLYLNSLIKTQSSLIFRQFLLRFSTNFADYFGSIISFIALAVPLFAGYYDDLDSGDLSQLISQNSFMTMYLINCFTRLIDLSTNFSIFLGTFRRVNELNIFLESNINEGSSGIVIQNQYAYQNEVDDFNSYFEMTDVTIKTPLNEMVIENLNLQITPKRNLIITGPSGIGKTSILRSLKGIWSIFNGNITSHINVNNPNTVMFLSNKPVITTGCVAEQIIYPNIYDREQWLSNYDFQRLVLDILKFLDLENGILKRVNYDIHCDLNQNWIDLLSAGEVQRFNLARIFYHQPKLVFLDECTTALPEDIEKKILNEMINKYQMTIVTCGHRQSLKQYHQMELKINADHDFELIDLNKST